MRYFRTVDEATSSRNDERYDRSQQIRHIQGIYPLSNVGIKRRRRRRCAQPFFVEHSISRSSRSLMRPFSNQRTPWFALPMPVFAEPTCGRIEVKDLTNLAGK